jgi:type III restriction enzyme
MNPIVNAVANRLSLRQPQREALEILDRVCEIVRPDKDTDPAQALQVIRSEFPSVADFERDFPSLCFALATGVGKTRLMGAFIAYLFRAEKIRHFFVLAPNLTIYNKLIADFTPNTPKYVFQGIAEFATNPPEIITGDNYESGRGVRGDIITQQRRLFGENIAFQRRMLFDSSPIHINIFNISKINSEVRGDKAPRIKRLSEYIGESYFEYLSKLDDLVLLMDESHRYRAWAGLRAINELKPILGLELTATPHVEKAGRAVDFKNVIYSYPLSKALTDGFVKEPAVATRENFVAGNYSKDALERLKLEDGVHVHEDTKVQLDLYARENGKRRVKPFMLVVAENTTHATELKTTIEDEQFFGGQYKGKVIEVHSKLQGEEKDETVQQLLDVENPDNPTEIVIHVNMLKEGWDVTNLYTIVPLRAANSKTLVEQSIGRGLRLPYGRRVGLATADGASGHGLKLGDGRQSKVSPVDRLTIVSHDKFQEIIDEANKADSIIRSGVVIGRDVPIKRPEIVESVSRIEERIAGTATGGDATATTATQKALFDTPEEKTAAAKTLEIIKQYERLRRSSDLQAPEVQREIVEKVKEALKPAQGVLAGIADEVDVAKVVKETTEAFVELSIDVPRIVVLPTGEVTCGYEDFDLDVRAIRYQPVSDKILVQNLHDHARYHLRSGGSLATEARLEDYLVFGLIDHDDISYDDHAEFLYKLSGQCVGHLRSYLKDEEDVLNVLKAHQKELVRTIHAQMQDHFREDPAEYTAKVSKGFQTIRSPLYTQESGQKARPFRVPVEEKQLIRGMLFEGFRKALFSPVKFDSDSERRFSVVLENDGDVLKWFKPAKGVFQIRYNRNDDEYVPDFAVETKVAKFLCEPKRADDVDDVEVLAKAKAAALWCRHASQHGEKPWSYLLIPHDAIDEAKTLAGLAASYTFMDH